MNIFDPIFLMIVILIVVIILSVMILYDGFKVRKVIKDTLADVKKENKHDTIGSNVENIYTLLPNLANFGTLSVTVQLGTHIALC
jgi:p-aminobenzoyl-glutamate transporter AbgT